jgi:hypothetical protein
MIPVVNQGQLPRVFLPHHLALLYRNKVINGYSRIVKKQSALCKILDLKVSHDMSSLKSIFRSLQRDQQEAKKEAV